MSSGSICNLPNASFRRHPESVRRSSEINSKLKRYVSFRDETLYVRVDFFENSADFSRKKDAPKSSKILIFFDETLEIDVTLRDTSFFNVFFD